MTETVNQFFARHGMVGVFAVLGFVHTATKAVEGALLLAKAVF